MVDVSRHSDPRHDGPRAPFARRSRFAPSGPGTARCVPRGGSGADGAGRRAAPGSRWWRTRVRPANDRGKSPGPRADRCGLQLYLYFPNASGRLALVRRARSAGCPLTALTGRTRREVRPQGCAAGARRKKTSFDWPDAGNLGAGPLAGSRPALGTRAAAATLGDVGMGMRSITPLAISAEQGQADAEDDEIAPA